MGLISRLIGGPSATSALGQAATGVAEVFVPNATKAMQAAQEAYLAALGEHGAEFQFARDGAFDRFVNGLNRLPRPLLALGTLGLFAYAMADPDGFSRRMIGLDLVPEPLWWLLAAVVGFYFGAREMAKSRGARMAAESARLLAQASGVAANIRSLEALRQAPE
ncbi:MAG: methionine synthase I, partial [Alphaproteobacteria bacterium HGW-Alphaproteobacteria-6]